MGQSERKLDIEEYIMVVLSCIRAIWWRRMETINGAKNWLNHVRNGRYYRLRKYIYIYIKPLQVIGSWNYGCIDNHELNSNNGLEMSLLGGLYSVSLLNLKH